MFSAQPGGPSRGWDRSSLAGHRPLLPAGGAVTLQPSGGGGARGPSRAVTPRPLLSLQEVLLKRAADLVEALYGMPHNNQVGGAAARQPLPARPGAPRGSHLRRVRAPFLCTRAPSRPVVAGRELDVVTGKGRFEIHPVAGTHGRPRPAGARAPAREPVPLGSGAVLCARGAWGRRADRCALNRLPERSSFPFPRSLAPGPAPCRGGRGARAGRGAGGPGRGAGRR